MGKTSNIYSINVIIINNRKKKNKNNKKEKKNDVVGSFAVISTTQEKQFFPSLSKFFKFIYIVYLSEICNR